jgi:hypothetical protein
MRESNMIVALPFGTLTALYTNQSREFIVNTSVFFTDSSVTLPEFASKTTIVYTILSGNGHFIGSKGYVTVTTDDTSIRRVDFWLDKQ